MNNVQTMKLTYVKPKAEVLRIATDMQLLNTSFQGGHNGGTSGGDLGDSGDNGHTGAESGGGGLGDAKRGTFTAERWDAAGGHDIWEE